MRTCRVCNENYPETSFSKTGKGHLGRKCKGCLSKYHQEWREKTREERRAYARQYQKKVRANWTPEQRAANNAKMNERRVVRQQALRMEVYNAYGGAHCACCGETEMDFLSIDHIHNNGYELRTNGQPSGEGLLVWLKKNNYPSDYQVLCMNCNHGKARNGGICPHKEGVTTIP